MLNYIAEKRKLLAKRILPKMHSFLAKDVETPMLYTHYRNCAPNVYLKLFDRTNENWIG